MKKHHQDVLGLALNDYFSRGHAEDIIVHSPDFEDDIIPVSYYFRNRDQLTPLEARALELCSGEILDAGAGAGSHSLILQEAAHKVAALDVSGGACEVMKKRGVRNVINTDLFIYQGTKYDTILMLTNGIGLVGSVQGLRQFISKLPSLVRPGGQVIFDSTNLIYLLRQEDGSVLFDLNDVYYGEIEFQIEYAGYISEAFSWLYVDFDTLDWIVDEAGFTTDLIMEGENMSYLARIIL